MNNPLQIINPKGLPVLVLAVLAFATDGASAQSEVSAQTGEVLTLDIQPQEAGAALVRLAQASGVPIVLAGADGMKVEVEGLKGEYRLEDALAALLTDTGLAYEFTSENLVVVQVVEQAEEPEAAEEAPAEDEDDQLELEAQVVTGSRLAQGDATAWVHSLSAEEIQALGVSSLEELFRTLPWVFSSITTQTNTFSPGVLANDTDTVLGLLGLGTSTINLRSMGSANTLVLVNGRRVAGLAGREDNFANILHVPLSAVERVDIQLDGASAVYGSDAVGGVVNFILKKHYKGLSATYRNEFSSTDADKSNLSLGGGYQWGSGHLGARLTHDTAKPVTNAKTGWTTNDYRDQYGPEFDLRHSTYGQPGIVCEFHFPRNFTYYYRSPRCSSADRTLYQLPAGHSGASATPEDFSTEIALFDDVVPQNGADSTHKSLTVDLEQYLGENLRLYADAQYSKLESYQDRPTIMYLQLVPASNAFNPFGRHMVVSYWPGAEIEAGLIPPAFVTADNKQRNYTMGFNWIFGEHELDFSFSRSKSVRFVWHNGFERNPPEGNPTQEMFHAALESSDPSQALNLFGNGSAQSSLLGELSSHTTGTRGTTRRTTYEPLLRGRLFDIWGGVVNYALGMSIREDAVYWGQQWYTRESSLNLVPVTTPGRSIGVDRPTQDHTAYFAELSFPIVGENNARPGLRALELSVQARRDSYKSVGAVGRDAETGRTPRRVYVPGQGWVDDNLLPDLVVRRVNSFDYLEVKESATSPRVGLRYKPTESFVLRASWSRSFRPPVFTDIYNSYGPTEYQNLFFDANHPSGEEVTIVWGVPHHSATNNPALDPEFSDNYSVGFDWSPLTLPGLRWAVNWSRIDFTNRIERTDQLLYNTPPELEKIVHSIPGIVERDADGYPIQVNITKINIAEKLSEIATAELQYSFSTPAGNFVPRLSYTRVLEESLRLYKHLPSIDRKGTVWGSTAYKLKASLSWWLDRFAVDLFAYYTPGYDNEMTGRCSEVAGRCASTGLRRPLLKVDSLTTVDLTATYRFDSGLQVRVGGRNVLNARAPTIWNGVPYNPTRWDARGRVLFLELSWEM